MNLLENEDLAWERFQQAVTDEDITTCYDMSLKDFEHFAVMIFLRYVCVFSIILSCIIFCFTRLIIFLNQLDTYRACQFIAASRQATKMDQERIRLEAKISDV